MWQHCEAGVCNDNDDDDGSRPSLSINARCEQVVTGVEGVDLMSDATAHDKTNTYTRGVYDVDADVDNSDDNDNGDGIGPPTGGGPSQRTIRLLNTQNTATMSSSSHSRGA